MEYRAPVIVNVYDLLWTNKYTLPVGLGVFHSGVEVYDVEFSYGGHQFEYSGIFDITPRTPSDLGPAFRFRESIVVGYTSFSPEDVGNLIEDLGDEFRGSRYHLMSKNCNHFSDTLVQTLCGRGIPNWINRLAHYSSYFPFLKKWLPQDWLSPNALRKNINSSMRTYEQDSER